MMLSLYMGKNTAGPGLLTTEYTKDTVFSGYQRNLSAFLRRTQDG